MDNKITRQLESFKNNLNLMPYHNKIIEYNKAKQIIENSYDSYEYFRIIIFDKLIYKKIDNKNELQIAFKDVRDALTFLSNQINLRFPKVFISLKDNYYPNSYEIDRTIISKFKMKINANFRVNGYISLIDRISNIIDSVDFVYLNNKTLHNIDTNEGNVLTINCDTNKTLSFDQAIYNIKQRVKELFKLYE